MGVVMNFDERVTHIFNRLDAAIMANMAKHTEATFDFSHRQPQAMVAFDNLTSAILAYANGAIDEGQIKAPFLAWINAIKK